MNCDGVSVVSDDFQLPEKLVIEPYPLNFWYGVTDNIRVVRMSVKVNGSSDAG